MGMNYRSVETGFWQDLFILSIPFKEKSFYMYLLTNPRVSFCGIFEIPLNLASTETGLSEKEVHALLEKFQNVHHRIVYSEKTQEVALVNWLKHNPFDSESASPTQKKGFENALGRVKDLDLIQYLRGNDTLSIPHLYPMHTVGSARNTKPNPIITKPDVFGEEQKKPTLEEVKAFCTAMNLRFVSPERFFQHYNDRGWVRKNGEAVKDWKTEIAAWNAEDEAKGKPENGKSSTKKTTARPDVHVDWMEEYLESTKEAPRS